MSENTGTGPTLSRRAPLDEVRTVSDDEKLTRDEFLFFQVVSMLQMAAMQQMGKLPNPLSQRIERDLDQAKASIDVLSMLKEKTAGNLNKRESEYLGKVLFESQMNYLDELKKPAPEAEAKADRTSTDAEESDADGRKESS